MYDNKKTETKNEMIKKENKNNRNEEDSIATIASSSSSKIHINNNGPRGPPPPVPPRNLSSIFPPFNNIIIRQQQQQQHQNPHQKHSYIEQKLKTFSSLDETTLRENYHRNQINHHHPHHHHKHHQKHHHNHLKHHHKNNLSPSPSLSSSDDEDDNDPNFHRGHSLIDKIPNRRTFLNFQQQSTNKNKNIAKNRGNFYQVNPTITTSTATTTEPSAAIDVTIPFLQTFSSSLSSSITATTIASTTADHPSLSLVPREPSTSSSASSSTTTTPSEGSFDLEKAIEESTTSTATTTTTKEKSTSSSLDRNYKCHQDNNRKRKQQKTISSNNTTTTTINKDRHNSSTFWDLITDVAKDLDLELKDLSPDSEIFEQPGANTTTTESTESIQQQQQHHHKITRLKSRNRTSKNNPQLINTTTTSDKDNVIGIVDNIIGKQPSSTSSQIVDAITSSSSIATNTIGQQRQQSSESAKNESSSTSNKTYTNQNESSSSSNTTNITSATTATKTIVDDLCIMSKWNGRKQSNTTTTTTTTTTTGSDEDIFNQPTCCSSTTSGPPSPPSPFRQSSNTAKEHDCSPPVPAPPEQFNDDNEECRQEQQQREANDWNKCWWRDKDSWYNNEQQQQHQKSAAKNQSNNDHYQWFNTASTTSDTKPIITIADRKATSKIIMQQHTSSSASQSDELQSNRTPTPQSNRYYHRRGRNNNTNNNDDDKCREKHQFKQQNSAIDSAIRTFESVSSSSHQQDRKDAAVATTTTDLVVLDATLNDGGGGGDGCDFVVDDGVVGKDCNNDDDPDDDDDDGCCDLTAKTIINDHHKQRQQHPHYHLFGQSSSSSPSASTTSSKTTTITNTTIISPSSLSSSVAVASVNNSNTSVFDDLMLFNSNNNNKIKSNHQNLKGRTNRIHSNIKQRQYEHEQNEQKHHRFIRKSNDDELQLILNDVDDENNENFQSKMNMAFQQNNNINNNNNNNSVSNNNSNNKFRFKSVSFSSSSTSSQPSNSNQTSGLVKRQHQQHKQKQQQQQQQKHTKKVQLVGQENRRSIGSVSSSSSASSKQKLSASSFKSPLNTTTNTTNTTATTISTFTTFTNDSNQSYFPLLTNPPHSSSSPSTSSFSASNFVSPKPDNNNKTTTEIATTTGQLLMLKSRQQPQQQQQQQVVDDDENDDDVDQLPDGFNDLVDDDDLPEGNVDGELDDDDNDNEENEDDLEEDEEEEEEEAPYEVDADDEQSNDMLDDDEEDEDNGPRSTSPPQPTATSIMTTKIDLSGPVVHVISMKVNKNNDNFHNNNNNSKKVKESHESEDSAADVSYERTSDNESDIEDTTLTTVNTSNPNNLDLKELSYDQRFKMTQNIWYLPHINRATVVHYLQGKSVGVFIVRQSSKPNTMAISVRLPQGRGPHVEHYLIDKVTKPSSSIKSTTVFRLEGSEHCFNSILQLVIHYSNCQDELPVQLGLPSVLITSTRSQLNSLALLGQEFWQSKFVSLKQLPRNSLNTETLAMLNNNSTNNICEEPRHHQLPSGRQLPKRNNSNSSESNASKSSMSCSPMPPINNNIRSRRNTSDSASPTIPNSTKVSPPPLPPKIDPSQNSPLIGSKNKSIIDENRISPTVIDIHDPNIPKLPPRGNYVPPPIPPRNRNSPGSTPPPPLPANGPPLSSLRSKKPKQPLHPQDLLSPMSMTESEIEMAKFSMAHKLTPNQILEVEEDPEPEEPKGKRNYYNHMVQAQNNNNVSSATPSPSFPMINSGEVISQTSPSLVPVQSPPPSLMVQDFSSKCDVCTQTYDTKQGLASQPSTTTNTTTANNTGNKIQRANSSLSCFYMDPIDALVAIHQARQQQQPKRHSDPELASSTQTNEIESSTYNQMTMSHSLESLLENWRARFSSAVSSNEFNSIRETILNERKNHNNNQSTNPLISKLLLSNHASRPDAFSTIDSAWQWHSGNHPSQQQQQHQQPHYRGQPFTPAMISASGLKVPIINRNVGGSNCDAFNKRSSITTNGSMKSDITTVEDLISAKQPELAVPKITHIDSLHHLSRNEHLNDRERKLTAKSIATDACTEFSEPWNMEMVESMFISELHHGSGSGPNSGIVDIIGTDDMDSTTQLLNNDLINFNSFLLNQDPSNLCSGVQQSQQQQQCEDDYDNVADDEDLFANNGIDGGQQLIKRDGSEITLKNSSQQQQQSQSLNNDDGIKLNIAYNISNYVFELASRKDNTFAKSIDNFIECTKETTDPNPSVILGYVRQFMNGMKNYLIKHGEGDFLKVVQNERSRLKPNQFLNIDSILEVSLQKLIIKPLKNFIYELFIRSHTMSGSLKILSTNIKLAQNKTPEELGIRSELLPIEPKVMAEIQKNLRRLQQSYSPIKKLEHLLRCIAILNGNYRDKILKCPMNGISGAGAGAAGVGGQSSKSFHRAFSGDDLLPMLVYLIVQCGVISAEIESEYMLGLLHPTILNGEGSYYLTILSSAIQVLKTMYSVDSSRQLEDMMINNGAGNNGPGASTTSGGQQTNNFQNLFSMLRSQPSEKLQRQIHNNNSNSNNVIANGTKLPSLALPSIANLQAYMKIMIPNELTSNITCKTVPVRHNMTTKEVCRMIAHTFRITNPEDYALYRIKENGLEEIQLQDNEYPQVIKSELLARGESAMFAYKRCDAKIIWPITSPN